MIVNTVFGRHNRFDLNSKTGFVKIMREEKIDDVPKGLFIGRTLIGFLVAPLVPGLLLILSAVIFSEGDNWLFKVWSFVIFFAFLTFVYPVILFAGLPVLLAMNKRGWTGLSHYLAIGAILGAILFVIAFVFFQAAVGLVPAIMLLLIPIFGMAAPVLFWVIVRPDRMKTLSEKKTP